LSRHWKAQARVRHILTSAPTIKDHTTGSGYAKTGRQYVTVSLNNPSFRVQVGTPIANSDTDAVVA
jgi:uncharacterized protein (DUF736 family)